MAHGDGSVYARGKNNLYWIRYYHNGKEFREPTKSADEKTARRILRDRLDDLAADRKGLQKFTTPDMKKITVHDLLENVKNDLYGKGSSQTLSTIMHADEAFGHIRAMDLTAQDVKNYIADELAGRSVHKTRGKGEPKPKKPATINRVTGMLRHAFKLAVEEEKLTHAPHVKQLEENNARKGFCTAAEFERIKANLPDVLADFAQFGFACGWRRGEISSLTWDNVPDGDRKVTIFGDQTKNGNPRSVPITGKLIDVIRRRRAAMGYQKPDGTTGASKLIFHREGLEVFEFRKAWATACKKAGKPGLLFHDLRRSFASASLQAGVPQLVIMGIGGWETNAMFKRYAIVPEREQENAMERVEAWHAAQTANAPAQQAQGNVRTMAASK